MTGNRRSPPRKSRHPCRILLSLVFFLAITTTTLSVTAVAVEPTIYHQTCNSDAQCLHGGTCRYTETGQGTYLQCQCAPGYTGSRCEHSCPLGCQHGGICRASEKKKDATNDTNKNHKTTTKDNKTKDDYVCRCRGYFTGRLCETPYENCNQGVRCYNHGTCQENENDHRVTTRACVCPPEWTGPSCETRVLNATSTTSDDHPVMESSWGRTTVWVLLVLCGGGGIGMIWVVSSHRQKWRSRRWRYNAVTRRALSKFQDRVWLKTKTTNHKKHRDVNDDDDWSGHYLEDDDDDNDDASNTMNLRASSFKTSKFRDDSPEYRNVI